MRTLTAIEFLRQKNKKQLIEKMEELRDILIFGSDGILSEKDFSIGHMSDTDMHINVDEIFFNIEGLDWLDWIKLHCETELESDKSITITRLR